jgi:hypothetical protein
VLFFCIIAESSTNSRLVPRDHLTETGGRSRTLMTDGGESTSPLCRRLPIASARVSPVARPDRAAQYADRPLAVPSDNSVARGDLACRGDEDEFFDEQLIAFDSERSTTQPVDAT